MIAAIVAERSVADPGLVLLVATAGILVLAAAVDLRSDHVVRGAVASIGIVVGPLPAASVVGLASAGAAYFGARPSARLGGLVLLMAGIAVTMWRHSRRPWDRIKS